VVHCRSSIRLLAVLLLLAFVRLGAVDGIAPVITLPSVAIEGTADVSSGDSTETHLTVADLAGELHWYNATGIPYAWIAFNQTSSVTSPPTGVVNAGVAIVETYQSGNGTWQWSSNNGSTWTDFSATPDSAFLLPAQGGWAVRFRAYAEARTGSGASLYFRAWDGSAGSPGTTADASAPGSPSAFSAEQREVAVEVTSGSRPPVVISDGEITGLWSGYTTARSRSVQVRDLLAGRVDDYDLGSDAIADAIGMRITAADSSAGTWHYGPNPDTSTELVLGVEDTVYLGPDSWLRYVPGSYGSNQDVYDALTFLASDGSDDSDNSGSIILRFSNDSPAIYAFDDGLVPETPQVTVLAEGTVSFTVQATDSDGDALTWDYVPLVGEVDLELALAGIQTVSDAAAYGSVTLNDNGTGTLTVTYANTDGSATSDELTLVVRDEFGAEDYITVQVEITPPVTNNAPSIISPTPAELAVAGQPWRFVLAANDDDANDSLSVSFSNRPTWLTGLNQLAARRWEVYGTPPAVAALSSFSATVSDGNGGSDSISLSVQVIAAESVSIEVAVPEVSTATAPRYGAIAPGSRAGFESINSAFGDLFTTQARALWWQSGYVDLPQIPSAPERTGVFLATTVARTLAVPAAPRHPAPFAIPLANGASTAGKWSFIGIPPLVFNAGQSGGTTTHPWNEFRLEDANGNAITDAETIRNALQTGSESDPAVRIRPYTWNGSAYVRTDTLVSGTAYWVANFSGLSYRLVRTSGSDSARFGSIDFSGQALAGLRLSAAIQTAASVSPRAGPPAPPAGPSADATSAEGGGGSCGSGLAGLLIAGLALLGLRSRRRN
jgi:hypothetical protein